MQVNTTPEVTFPKSGAFGPYLRVVMVNGTIALAGPFDREIGTTKQNYLSTGLGQGNSLDAITRHAPGTVMMTASGAIPQYGDVFADVNGQVTANTTGYYIGMAMEAASGAGAWFEVLRIDDRGGMAFVNETIGATVSNTTAETVLGNTFTIPANSIKVGDMIHVIAHALVTNHNSTDTLLLKLKITDGTHVQTLFATAAVAVAIGHIAVIDMIMVVRTVGNFATGTFIAFGSGSLGAAGTSQISGNLASTALDTTAAQTIEVTATWSVASANDVVELDALCVLRNGG